MACPICRKETQKDYRPFCSKRCADIDLGKWFNEEYSAPAVDEEALEATISELEKKDRPVH